MLLAGNPSRADARRRRASRLSSSPRLPVCVVTIRLVLRFMEAQITLVFRK